MPLSFRPRSYALSALLAGVLLVAGVSCPPPGGNDDGDPDRGRVCNVDAECDAGFRCDRENRRCVCVSDEACPPGLFCNAFTGACVEDVPGCTSDADCQSGQYCDIPTRTCRSRKGFCEPCAESMECGTYADLCLRDPTNQRKYCGQSCNEDEDCPEGATCQSLAGERTCWPAVATCEQFKGCNPNSGQSCETDQDCTEGEDQVCDQTQGICVARVPTCPYGMVCSRETGQCEAACVTDDDCYATDASCDPESSPCRCTNNECVHVFLCTQDSDCESGRLCVVEPGQTEGECRPDCAGDDSLCPQGMLCMDRGARHECVAGCRLHSDCTVSENCIANTCRSLSSEGRQHCQMPEVCDLCEGCLSDAGGGYTCQQLRTDQGELLTCRTCTTSVGTCSGTAPIWCCAIFGTTGYRGIDCSDGQLCPAGHQCVEIMHGGVPYGNCFPTSDSVCDAASCRD